MCVAGASAAPPALCYARLRSPCGYAPRASRLAHSVCSVCGVRRVLRTHGVLCCGVLARPCATHAWCGVVWRACAAVCCVRALWRVCAACAARAWCGVVWRACAACAACACCAAQCPTVKPATKKWTASERMPWHGELASTGNGKQLDWSQIRAVGSCCQSSAETEIPWPHCWYVLHQHERTSEPLAKQCPSKSSSNNVIDKQIL